MTDREKLRQVQQNLINQAEDIELFLNDDPISDFQATISGNRINCTWKANQSGEMDIEYYAAGVHKEWQHSVAKYIDLIDIEDESVSIGIGDFPEWKLRAVVGDWKSEIITVKKVKREPGPEPKPAMSTEWESIGKIIQSGDSEGTDYRVTGVLEGDETILLYQSKHNLSGKARTAVSGAYSDDLKNWSFLDNPIIADAMSWQGTDSQGRAHRTAGGACIRWGGQWIHYYRDRDGRYPGIRAMGKAISEDGRKWTQDDRVFITVADVDRMIPGKYFEEGKKANFSQGRVYINDAATDDNYVYLLINTIVNGVHQGRVYQEFLIRGTDPHNIDSFEFYACPWVDEGGSQLHFFNYAAGKWYAGRGENVNGERKIGVQVLNDLSEPYTIPHFFIPTVLPVSMNPSAVYFFQHDGWHCVYSDRETNRNIYLSSEKTP
jgi:hypothetical protein